MKLRVDFISDHGEIPAIELVKVHCEDNPSELLNVVNSYECLTTYTCAHNNSVYKNVNKKYYERISSNGHREIYREVHKTKKVRVGKVEHTIMCLWRITSPNRNLSLVLDKPIKVGDRFTTKITEGFKRLFKFESAKTSEELNQLIPYNEWINDYVRPEVAEEWRYICKDYGDSLRKCYLAFIPNLRSDKNWHQRIIDVIDFEPIVWKSASGYSREEMNGLDEYEIKMNREKREMEEKRKKDSIARYDFCIKPLLDFVEEEWFFFKTYKNGYDTKTFCIFLLKENEIFITTLGRAIESQTAGTFTPINDEKIIIPISIFSKSWSVKGRRKVIENGVDAINKVVKFKSDIKGEIQINLFCDSLVDVATNDGESAMKRNEGDYEYNLEIIKVLNI